jgi:Skp family chaperone for outer membrane proteins
MRFFRIVAASAILAAFAALPAYAQGTRPVGNPTPPRPTAPPAPNPAPANVVVPDSKIALVNTEAFGDEKAGIVRFINALRTLSNEVKPKQDEMLAIQARMQQLQKDINTLSQAAVADPKSIQSKQEEGARLERELKYKKEDYDAMMQRRYRDVVGPISADIGKELDVFAAQRGITMVLDVSKLLPVILTAKNETDITMAFIAYYNAKNPGTPATTPPK